MVDVKITIGNIQFEWNENKNISNQMKHSVSFEKAALAFQDVFSIELIDDDTDYGEERSIIIAIIGSEIYSVVYTERGDNIRIISARTATKGEKNEYYLENSEGNGSSFKH